MQTPEIVMSRQVQRQLRRLQFSPHGPISANYAGNYKAHRAFNKTKLYAPNGARELARRAAQQPVT